MSLTLSAGQPAVTLSVGDGVTLVVDEPRLALQEADGACLSVTQSPVMLTQAEGVTVVATQQPVSLSINAVVGGGGGGGGASALDDLTDVDVSTNAPREGQSLVYDGTEWNNNYPPLLFVTFLYPDTVTSFTDQFGARPGDAGGLAAVGVDATWWFHNENNAADNGIWVSTASPGTATQFTPQPGGIGSSIFTYLRSNGTTFVGSYLTWVNVSGGTAADYTQWSQVFDQADNVLFVKTTPANWNTASDEPLQNALDELAARIKALEP